MYTMMLKKKKENEKIPLGNFKFFYINNVAINLHDTLCLNLCKYLLIPSQPDLSVASQRQGCMLALCISPLSSCNLNS